MVGMVTVSNSSRIKYLRTLPGRHLGQPDLRYIKYRVSFPGVNGLGSYIDHPSTSSAKVKERVELYV